MSAALPSLNLVAGATALLEREIVTILDERQGARLERIVSLGQASPEGFWYEQKEDEWVVVLAGRARLRIEDETKDRELGPFDCLFLPAGCRHRVTWTLADQPTVWLALFLESSRGAGSVG